MGIGDWDWGLTDNYVNFKNIFFIKKRKIINFFYKLFFLSYY